MTITLRPEQEKLIAQAMQTGAYHDPYEVIERALEVLLSEDEWLHDSKQAIADKIERAFGQFERGDFLTSKESRANMEERKSAWFRDPTP
jgi:hypothetical protein